ncbi:MAG: F0F1 ATP synthase subunit delta [Lachnospiraceae bacterium]|nr:F0F1 ATP synthase subunit delta [Lachnospiraceae bacterium]
MQQERIRNNAIVLSQLSIDKEEILEYLRETDSLNEYQSFMKSPVIPSRVKEDVERQISKRAGRSKLFTDFLIVMIRNHNEGLLADIIREYIRIEDQKAGFLDAELCYAKEEDIVSGEKKAKKELMELFPGKQFRFCLMPDPSLIGGYIVRCNGYEIDHSYKGQLKQLEDRINGR